MARYPPALPRALHADLQLLAQPGRAVVRPDHPARHSARLLPHGTRTDPADRHLCGALQSDESALRVDGDGRVDPGEAGPTCQSNFWVSTLATVLYQIPTIPRFGWNAIAARPAVLRKPGRRLLV